MKKLVIVAVLAALIAGAAPTQALAKKTLRQRITLLERRDAKKDKQIAALTSLARLANSRAADAQASFMFLSGCILVQPAGAADVLDAASSSTFSQGSVDGVVPDFFQWLPVARSVVVPEGPDYLAMLDPNCIVSPSPAPAPRSSKTGWNPRPLVLR